MKKVVLLLIGLLITSSLFAQSISGTVTDSDGNPLAGANVEVVGTGQGSSSDASGSYMIMGLRFINQKGVFIYFLIFQIIVIT